MATYYSNHAEKKSIILEEIPELGERPLYAVLNVKDLTSSLDLKKEVILTMLN